MSRFAMVLLPLLLAQAGGCQDPDRFAAWPIEEEPEEFSQKMLTQKDGPWVVLDFDDYETVEQIEAVPGVRLSALQTHTLTTGLEDTPWGGTKAIRLNFPVALSSPDMGAGVEIRPPDAGAVRPRELWIEVWTRFSEHWTTGGIEKYPEMTQYTGSHKFLLMHEAGDPNGWRWEDFHGIFGQPDRDGQRAIMISGGTKGIDRREITTEFDEQWHRYRYHARMDPINGRWMMDQDGTSTLGIEGLPLGYSPDSYFEELQFGANNNRGTDGVNDMWYELAEIRIYSTDPGWVLP